MGKKVLIIHFRTGERDGVSLEIEKRRKLLQKLGYQVILVTGYDPRSDQDKNIHLIPQLDIKRRLASVLRESFFFNKILDDNLTWMIFHSEEEKIYRQFLKIIKKEKPDLIFIHNLMSIAYHLPATTAILKVLDRNPVPVVCVHHDFWWERNLFHKTKYYFINDIIGSIPPKKSYILRHQVINSLAKQKLMDKLKIDSESIGDFFDFDLPMPEIDNYNSDFLNSLGIKKGEIVVLHSTRIIERKAIENAILFVARLKKIMRTQVHLLLPNFIEVESELYFKRLKNLAMEYNVNFIWVGDRIQLQRKQINGFKHYSFWDCYLFADLMTYTSYAEGFGNQLLEAFWAKKLPVVFEYPVFSSDIKKDGYEYVSLGNKMRKRADFYFVSQDIINKAAKDAANYLSDKNRLDTVTKKNFLIAKDKRDIKFLETSLRNIISDL